jgi:hypothetical protein
MPRPVAWAVWTSRRLMRWLISRWKRRSRRANRRCTRQPSLQGPGAPPGAACALRGFPLHATPEAAIVVPARLDRAPAPVGIQGGMGNVPPSQVHPQRPCTGDGRVIGEVGADVQPPAPFAVAYQVRLGQLRATGQNLRVVHAQAHVHRHRTARGAQAYLLAPKLVQAGGVEGDGPIRPEGMLGVRVHLVGVSDHGNGADGMLGLQTKEHPHVLVDQVLQARAAERALTPGHGTDVVAGPSKRFL